MRHPASLRGSLTQDKLKDILEYDIETGIFRWRKRVAKCIHVGQIAGTISNKGYVIIAICGYQYCAHNLAWLYMYNEWTWLDHKDRDRSNNALNNLRKANAQQNNGNKKCINSLGVKGVCKRGNRYIAQITIDYQNNYLGMFKTVEEAKEAYKIAAKKHFGEFAGD